MNIARSYQGMILAYLLLLLSACSATESASQPTPSATPGKPATSGSQIVAEGKVQPSSIAILSMQTSGVVGEVLVKEGDQVKVNQVLVRLDSAAQQARLSQAKAQLQQAEANLQRLKEGPTDAEVKVAEANLQQAQATLRQVQSSVSPEDIAAARAAQRQAQLQLSRLQAGPRAAELRQSQAQVNQAQIALDQQRTHLSSAKTQSQQRLYQASENLRQAQSAYETAYWNWQYVEEHNKDPLTAPKLQTDLTENQRQRYYDAYKQSEAGLRRAELAVHEAQTAYDTAREAEITGLREAEQRVVSAQAGQEQIRQSITADQIAAAQSQLSSARAQLRKLTGSNRADQLLQAEAGVAVAEANLEHVKTGPRPSEITASEAQVASAKADVEAAQVALDQTKLRAPFSGTLITFDLRLGEFAQVGSEVARIGNTDQWQIETSDLSELNIARVKIGAPVTMTFDAIPDLRLEGKVDRIRSFGENRNGDTIYRVVIIPNTQNSALRWNMTVVVSIDTTATP